MKLINKDTDYAIRVLLFMAKNKDDKFCASDISDKLKISKSFLRKILQVLNAKGILSSFKGKSGGFRLKMHPSKIFLTDLIKIFQGPVELTNCFIKKKPCSDKNKCLVRGKLQEIERYVKHQLESISIQSLMDK